VPVDARTSVSSNMLMPFTQHTGISSTLRIAKSWGLLRPQRRPMESRLGEDQKETGTHIWYSWFDLWSKTGRESK